MITENVMVVFFGILARLLPILPDVAISLDDTLFEQVYNFIGIVLYLFPTGTLLAIVAIVIALNSFRIVVSLLKTIMQLIPFV